LAPHTISNFESKTGIKVRVAYFDANETLESRILTGHSGFDVVVPTAPFCLPQIHIDDDGPGGLDNGDYILG
jgi:putrescine transport system substrate-binding protein